jgi:hypothetical protein
MASRPKMQRISYSADRSSTARKKGYRPVSRLSSITPADHTSTAVRRAGLGVSVPAPAPAQDHSERDGTGGLVDLLEQDLGCTEAAGAGARRLGLGPVRAR